MYVVVSWWEVPFLVFLTHTRTTLSHLLSRKQRQCHFHMCAFTIYVLLLKPHTNKMKERKLLQLNNLNFMNGFLWLRRNAVFSVKYVFVICEFSTIYSTQFSLSDNLFGITLAIVVVAFVVIPHMIYMRSYMHRLRIVQITIVYHIVLDCFVPMSNILNVKIVLQSNVPLCVVWFNLHKR